MRRHVGSTGFWIACAALAACTARAPSSGSGPAAETVPAALPSASASAKASGPTRENEGETRLPALLEAEHTRVSDLVLPSDVQSRDVLVRRAAARALARIGGDTARPMLLRALSDEDGDVVAWAAYGIGFFCKGKDGVESKNVSALAVRAASLLDAPGADAKKEGAQTGKLDPVTAIARAIGRCGADTSEETLRAWLSGDRKRAGAAALGLFDLVTQKKRLLEDTWVLLLGLAAGNASSPPMTEALYAFGRVDNVPPSVQPRVFRVASARLAEPSIARIFAVRALSRAGEPAVSELGRVLTTPAVFSAAERAEAARNLKRLGAAGQSVLVQVLPSLMPSTEAAGTQALMSDELSVLLTVLESLTSAGKARPTLTAMAKISAPPDEKPALIRRLSWIRCLSAKVLANDNAKEPLLTGCDLSGADGIGARAAIDVLGRGNLVGARYRAWLETAMHGSLRARERAIELITEHEELSDTAPVLAAALQAKELGLLGTAAEVIAKQPARASETAPKGKQGKKRKRDKAKENEAGADSVAVPVPSPAITKALLAALSPQPPAVPDPEVIDGVIDAVGALGLTEALLRLEELCKSAQPTTREHAEKALGLVAPAKKITCPAPPQGGTKPAELSALERAPLKLVFDTDIGELGMTLDPAFAPVTVTRIAELVRADYYKNMVVHRVVPAFVTQFGAPLGDGFGGPPEKPSLRCETSPLPFEALTVGMALAGRDTGSSQLFVMHAYAPHLDGNYAQIGTASGAWAAFVDGDRIHNVKIVQ